MSKDLEEVTRLINLYIEGAGKGNADKEVMYKSFLLETGFPVKDVIAPDKKNVCSPVSDIIDSYFICKKLYDNIVY